jgi:hypothetical protein
MTDNIVATISEYLTPDIIGKLATASGLDRSMAGEAVSAAVPTILNSLAELVTQPGGARRLMSVISEQTGDLQSFASSLIAPSQSAATGNSILSTLIGGSTPSTIASGIANMLGVSTNAVQTILGLVTPLVLGGLRRVQNARGLDADGLARMLSEQKENITDAIPAGLVGFLRKSGLVDGAAIRPSTRTDLPRVTSSATTRTRQEPSAEKGVAWPYWALAVAVLGGLLWALLPRDDDGVSQTASVTGPPQERSMLPQAAKGTVVYIVRPNGNWTSIGASSNEYVNRVIYSSRGDALGTIRDVLMGPDSKPQAAVISVGRYLGIGDKVVAVPFHALNFEQREGERRLVIDLAKETLQTAPQFENIPAPKQ